MFELKLKRSIMSVYIVFLLITTGFIGILVFEGVVDEGSVEAATTRYVGGSGPGNYTTIQAAITAASSGDTIRVYQGTYKENLDIGKQVKLIGNGSSNTIIDGTRTWNRDVVRITVNSVNITGFTIMNGSLSFNYYGVRLDNVGYCKISNNNISSNTVGIYINVNSDNTIINNTCNSNTYYGIYLYQSNYNDIIDNICNLNQRGGIYLAESNYNTLINNKASSSMNGIMVYNSYTNNLINNSALLSGNYGIYLDNANTHTLINNTVSSNTNHGIYLYDADRNILTNNTCNSNNANGIYIVSDSNDNRLIKNTVLNNINNGIYLDDFCYYNFLENNTVLQNTFSGILISDSGYNTISNCNASWNNQSGILLNSNSNYNTLSRNNASGNNQSGINISSAHYNKFINNSAHSNKAHGFYLSSSNNNNPFTNNTASKNNGNGIYLESSSIGTFKNNTASSNIGNGIYFYSSSTNTFSNINASKNNGHGIFLNSFNSKTLNSTNTSENKGHGIYLYSSNSNTLKNINTSDNKKAGVCLKRSNSITLTNVTMFEDGIFIDGNLNHWDSHTIDINNTVNGKPVYYWKNKIGGAIPGNAGEVILANCQNVTIENQNFSNGSAGILLGFSKNCTICNNTARSNNIKGIYLCSSDKSVLSNNTISSNVEEGIRLHNSNHNKLINITSANNGVGIYLNNSKNNTITDSIAYNNSNGIHISSGINTTLININASNNEGGIYVYDSNNNIIKNNTAFSNNDFGFTFYKAGKNSFTNNTALNNKNIGINFSYSNSNTIINNTLSFNKLGSYIGYSNNNIFTENIYNSNSGHGIILSQADRNTLEREMFINNPIGINLTLDSDNCNIINTTIINSIISTLRLDDDSHAYALNCSLDWSKIKFFDLVSTLTVQWYMNIHVTNNLGLSLSADIKIKDQSSNTVYSGKTGTAGWKKWIICDQDIRYITGTLISRTPHTVTVSKITFETVTTIQNMNMNRLVNIILDNDVTPPEPPTNLVFTNIGVNSINFSWAPPVQNDVYGFNVYINNTGSSTEFHLRGSTQNTYYNVSGLTEKTTYYFMIKSYDDVPWESTPLKGHNTTLDVTSPEQPTSLVAKNPTGHEITLSWVPNTESDLDGYCIYMNNSGTGFSGPYHEIDTVDSTATQYKVTDLDEEVTYYFKIMAFDDVPNYSLFSNIANATTLDVTPPRPPSGLEATALSKTSVYLKWDPNPEEDVEGYTIYYAFDAILLKFEVLDTRYGDNTSYLLDKLAEKLTLHFKLTAFDEVPNNSPFSDVITVTTLDETPPTPPTGLTVANTSHNTLTLSWDPNIESDVVGYKLYRSNLPTGNYNLVNAELINTTEYNDTGLSEFSKYYYKIKAVDDFQLESDFSEMAPGCTLHAPRPPEINVAPGNFKLLEDTIDSTSINLHTWFSDINENEVLRFRCTGQEHFEVTIFQDNGTVILKPEQDWSGRETLKFYASDGSTEISDKVTITVLPVNDPPGPIEIIEPGNGIVIYEGKTLDFEGSCTDPDLPYGDSLTFYWFSNISGNFGEGEKLSAVLLAPGQHRISFEVTDIKGESVNTTINVSVTPITKPPINETTPEQPADDEKDYTTVITISLVIIILIIIFVALLFFLSRKDKSKVEEDKTKQKPKLTQEDLLEIERLEFKQKREYFCPKCGQSMDYVSEAKSYHCKYCNIYEKY